MSNAVIPSEVLEAALKLFILEGSDSVTVKLFVNDVTPTKDTDSGDFIEASYPGYAECAVLVAPAIPDGNQWHFTPGHATFAAPTSGSGVDCYGVWVEFEPPGGIDPLLYSMRFDSAPLTLAPGDLDLAIFLDLHSLDVLNP